MSNFRWEDQIWEYPRRYRLQQNADGTVDVIPEKGKSIQEGTPVNAENLNTMVQNLDDHINNKLVHGTIEGDDGHFYKAMVGEDQLFSVLGSSSSGGDIRKLIEDSDYFYIWRETGKKPYKVRKSDLVTVATGGDAFGHLDSPMAVDDKYLYTVHYESPKNTLIVLDKNTLSEVKRSIWYHMEINDIATDSGEYLYVSIRNYGDAPDRQIIKVRKSDLEVVAESEKLNYTIKHIIIDDKQLYCSIDNRIHHFNKSTFTHYSDTSNHLMRIYNMVSDDEYIYAAAEYGVKKIRKSPFGSIVSESNSKEVYSLTLVGDFVYATIKEIGVVKFKRTNLSEVKRWISEGIVSIHSNIRIYDDEMYVTGINRSTATIMKMEEITPIRGLRRVN